MQMQEWKGWCQKLDVGQYPRRYISQVWLEAYGWDVVMESDMKQVPKIILEALVV